MRGTRFVAIGQAFALLALLASGCATPALWKHTAAREWWPRSSPDQLLVTTTTGRQDVIVVFHQTATVGEKTKNRLVAWNLRDPKGELTVGRGALRRLTNVCDRVQIMTVFSQDAIPGDATSTLPGYAVQGPPWCPFTVHLDGVPSGPFELPASHEKCRSFMRVALAPIAIATDAALVATVAMAGAAGSMSVGH